jgi:hypothetical protein
MSRATVRVVGHDLNSIDAIGLEDADSTRRADAWLWRKIMISRTVFCSATHRRCAWQASGQCRFIAVPMGTGGFSAAI